jgi:low affinity Fe/Cu permease
MATRHQHWNDYRDVPHGLSYPTSQNKDALAIHLKLNEIVAVLEGASNRLIDVEELSEKELRTLRKHFSTLARLAEEESDIAQSHSVEEADRRHQAKSKRRPKPHG